MKKKIPVSRKLYEQWLPLFQDGNKAKHEKAEPSFRDLPRQERAAVRRRSDMGDEAFTQMYKRISVLSESIIQREMNKPRSFHVLIEHDDLESAAYEGIYSALCNMDLHKMKSPTNYVLQWVDTKVTRAALKMEASTGLSPSKLRLFKKIAAVRNVMREKGGREPTDEEVLLYFHSGNADFHSVNGRVGSNTSSYKSNAKIKLRDIEEQGRWDKGYNLHTPVTDTHEIDAAVHSDIIVDIDDAILNNTESFWRGYMTFIGIASGDQDIIADELQLFNIRPTDSDDALRRHMAKDFIHLIQNPRGRIAEYSKEYAANHGDGFWRVFIENLHADTNGGRRKPLHLTVLRLH